MQRELAELERFFKTEQDCVLVTVETAKGSTPRLTDAWMLVGKNATLFTIGGGQLEYMAIDKARILLATDERELKLDIPLGPEIGQCCGGHVTLKLDRVSDQIRQDCIIRLTNEIEQRPEIYIFGAGHVGLALARAFELLPVKTILIDSRQNELSNSPDHIDARLCAIPEAEVTTAKPCSAFIILTHDHALDFLVAKQALQRGDAAYIGMIGSRTKRVTFERWLKQDTDNRISAEQLVCPIGKSGLEDKRPQMIAAMVVPEVLQAIFKRCGHPAVSVSP